VVGGDHPMIRLYDINTTTPFTCAVPSDHHTGPVNQVGVSVEVSLEFEVVVVVGVG